PLLGRVGDQYGRRRVILAAMTVFFAGSIGAVFAPNVGVLIAFRMIQGVGNVVVPLGFSVVKDHYPPARLRQATGFLTAGLPIGTGAGLLVGFVVDYVSW